MQVDHVITTGASVSYLSGGKVIVNETMDYVQANKGGVTSDGKILADRLGAVAYPGDTFAIVAKDTGGNAVVVRAAFTWEEI